MGKIVLLLTLFIAVYLSSEHRTNVTKYADKTETKRNENISPTKSSSETIKISKDPVEDLNFHKLNLNSEGTNKTEASEEKTEEINDTKETMLGCRGEDDVLYDNYFVYKRPTDKKLSIKYNGINIHIGEYELDSELSVLSKTLQPIFKRVELKNSQVTVNFIIWNDHSIVKSRGTGPSTLFGHSKGVLVFSNKGGFLLVHTIPKFMTHDNLRKYEYPDSGFKNGQIALCVTMNASENLEEYLKTIRAFINQMRSFRPKIIWQYVNTGFDMEIEANLKLLLNEQNSIPVTPIEPVVSSLDFTQGFKVHFFGRYKELKYYYDMRYDAFAKLATEYKTSLYVQTWNRDGWYSYKTEDAYWIENLIKFRYYESTGKRRYTIRRWTSGSDHSKWAISSNKKYPLVCMGDLNRHPTTMRRGGLFVCKIDESLYKEFYNIVTHFEKKIG